MKSKTQKPKSDLTWKLSKKGSVAVFTAKIELVVYHHKESNLYHWGVLEVSKNKKIELDSGDSGVSIHGAEALAKSSLIKILMD